jgi:hypothetical protein
MRWKAQVLLAYLAIGVLLVACGPGGSKLPKGASDALANAVSEHEGAHFKYSIVSVQKATLTSSDLEADELWCVVIDQQVTMPWLWTEVTSNRFLVVKEGDVWDVGPAEAIWGLELEEILPGPEAIGCDNLIESGE